MRSYAENSKTTQQAMPSKTTTPGLAHFTQNPKVNSILHTQRTIGNKAVKRLLKKNTADNIGDSATTEFSGFNHDFSRIPISSNGAHTGSLEEEKGMKPVGRAEFPSDFVGPLQPGDTRAVPFGFVGPLQPGVTRSSSFHPTMTVVTPGRATGRCGGFEHKVRWGVPAAANRAAGWIVQKVDIQFDVKDCNNRPVTPHPIDNPANYPFWEAWEFTSGSNVWVGPASAGTRHSGDTFSGSDYGPGTKGKISLIGEVKGIVGFTLPSGMTVRNTFPAWSLPYTRTQPAQFGSTLTGASHVVTSEWNCCPSGTVTQATNVTATP